MTTSRRVFRLLILALIATSLTACHFHRHRGGCHSHRPTIRFCR